MNVNIRTVLTQHNANENTALSSLINAAHTRWFPTNYPYNYTNLLMNPFDSRTRGACLIQVTWKHGEDEHKERRWVSESRSVWRASAVSSRHVTLTLVSCLVVIACLLLCSWLLLGCIYQERPSFLLCKLHLHNSLSAILWQLHRTWIKDASPKIPHRSTGFFDSGSEAGGTMKAGLPVDKFNWQSKYCLCFLSSVNLFSLGPMSAGTAEAGFYRILKARTSCFDVSLNTPAWHSTTRGLGKLSGKKRCPFSCGAGNCTNPQCSICTR